MFCTGLQAASRACLLAGVGHTLCACTADAFTEYTAERFREVLEQWEKLTEVFERINRLYRRISNLAGQACMEELSRRLEARFLLFSPVEKLAQKVTDETTEYLLRRILQLCLGHWAPGQSLPGVTDTAEV